jgi:hypothetical protein
MNRNCTTANTRRRAGQGHSPGSRSRGSPPYWVPPVPGARRARHAAAAAGAGGGRGFRGARSVAWLCGLWEVDMPSIPIPWTHESGHPVPPPLPGIKTQSISSPGTQDSRPLAFPSPDSEVRVLGPSSPGSNTLLPPTKESGISIPSSPRPKNPGLQPPLVPKSGNTNTQPILLQDLMCWGLRSPSSQAPGVWNPGPSPLLYCRGRFPGQGPPASF